MADIEYTTPEYDNHKESWEFYLRSYMGGQDYRDGSFLTKYVNEDNDSYGRRIDLTPMDNHARNIVHIYSSFLWRVPPTRSFNSLANNVALEPFLKDCDLDGRSLNTLCVKRRYGHQCMAMSGSWWTSLNLMPELRPKNWRKRFVLT